MEITNTGTANLNVSGISLAGTDPGYFSLDLTGGSNPCISVPRTITPGSSCTMEIAFQPQAVDAYGALVRIISDDPDTSTIDVPLGGIKEAVSELNVRINQYEINCNTGDVTAYVSVTEQGGYAVTDLTIDDFAVTETGEVPGPPSSALYVTDTNFTLSAALVLDFSTSVIGVPKKESDMKEAAIGFINRMGLSDEAEIVKFGGPSFAVVQDWTSNKTLLTSAINADWNFGTGTRIYDAIMLAVDETAARMKARKAVIVISDGFSHNDVYSLDNVVANAISKNIPIFPVGLGDNVDVVSLTAMADNTGGQFFLASTSANLETIYQQLANVLLSHQYVLTYSSVTEATGNTTIRATLPLSAPAIWGEDTKEISFGICP
jgi:Ca-activated chloride channel family protein